jgi:outer membrane protein OmpA-like peptidoglycan-associated protein
MKRWIMSLLFVLVFGLSSSNGHADEILQVLSNTADARISCQTMDQNQLLLTVLDATDQPIRGLTADDIEVKLGSKKAKILTFEPLETNEKVGLNIVMVVDNSSSMKRRKAIKPLLSAMQDFLKIMRPMDTIHMIVFDDDNTMQMDGRDLHVKTLKSTSVIDLKNFLDNAFDKGLSSKTVLYEAMVAGMAAMRKMPEKANKFFVVFTDGEDINSAFKGNVATTEAERVSNFEAYVVDYMPGAGLNPFMETFAKDHGGKVWKATSATDLLPIFQSFSTRLRYRYVATYRFLDPPTGTIGIQPAKLHLDAFTMLDGAPLKNTLFFQSGKSDISQPYVLFKNKEQAASFNPETLNSAMDRYSNLLNIMGQALAGDPGLNVRIMGYNDDRGGEKDNLELSERRAQAVKTYLNEIWGVAASRLWIEAGNLPEKAAPAGKLGANAENRRVEIIYDAPDKEAGVARTFIGAGDQVNGIDITPEIKVEYGVADWELNIVGNTEPLTGAKGEGDLAPDYKFTLDSLDLQKLATLNQLEARLKVTDTNGDTFETDPALCAVMVSKRPIIHEILPAPAGTLAMVPASFTIEELTTIDSSPLLNYIYFESEQDSIPEKYVTFRDQAAAKAFSESALIDPMEKYHNILNIIGKRLLDNPEATIEIIGCNSNFGPERKRTDLSRLRAQSVHSYLKYIWGVDSRRMTVTARNLPAAASSGKTKQGRAENRRVEILSDAPEILDVIRSTHVEAISNARRIKVVPDIQAGYDLKRWKIDLMGDGTLIRSMDGAGALAPDYIFELENADLLSFEAFANISAEIQVEDMKGGQFKARAPDAPVTFIRKEERSARKEGYKVMERYALILFDFNSAKIKDRNQAIVDHITERVLAFPEVILNITGHTDDIGKEEYNLKLSKKRAKAVYDQLVSTIGETRGVEISFTGVGPSDPLYDNTLPYGRALNRTVTVTLEYEVKE